jgi:hypothetical protein
MKPEFALRSGLHRLGLRFFVDWQLEGARRRADIVFPELVAGHFNSTGAIGIPVACTAAHRRRTGTGGSRGWQQAGPRDKDTVAKRRAAVWTIL